MSKQRRVYKFRMERPLTKHRNFCVKRGVSSCVNLAWTAARHLIRRTTRAFCSRSLSAELTNSRHPVCDVRLDSQGCSSSQNLYQAIAIISTEDQRLFLSSKTKKPRTIFRIPQRVTVEAGKVTSRNRLDKNTPVRRHRSETKSATFKRLQRGDVRNLVSIRVTECLAEVTPEQVHGGDLDSTPI